MFHFLINFAEKRKRRYLHVAASHDEDTIYVITAYYPDPEVRQSDFKTKK